MSNTEQKLPKVVLYAAFGRAVPALVLAARFGETSHLGADGEPLLTLAFIDKERETGLSRDKDGAIVWPAGREPQVFIERDVVHISHEFDEEFVKLHGSSPAQIAAQRGHGEWTEFVGEEEGALVEQLRAKVDSIDDELTAALKDAADARGAQQIAEAKVAQLDKDLAAAKAATAPSAPSAPSGSN